MTRYRLAFYGRKLRAIGIESFQVVDVTADSPESAKLKAYDTHEHIRGNIAVKDLNS